MKKICTIIGIAIVSIAIIVIGVFMVMGRTYKVKNPVATIVIEGYDNPIKIELDPQAAPNAVANFIRLANNGFYTDYKMKIGEKMITSDDTMNLATMSNIVEYPEKDYIYGIKGDFIANGHENLIKHKKGVITMLIAYQYFGADGFDTANSYFNILTQDYDEMNEYNAAFGTIIEGMDVLDKIAESRVESDTTEDEEISTEETSEDTEENTITIKSITVDTFGIDYGVPETVDRTEYWETIDSYLGTNYSGTNDLSTTITE